MKSKGTGYIVIIIVICIVIFGVIYFKGDSLGLGSSSTKWMAGLGVVFAGLFFLFLRPIYHMFNIWSIARLFRSKRYTPPQGTSGATIPADPWVKLHLFLKQCYGRKWNKKKPWLLVMGNQKRIEKWQPELANKGWYDGWEAVLIKVEDDFTPENWRKLRGGRYRPPDGLIILPTSITDWSPTADKLVELNHSLGWRLPIYLVLADDKFGPIPKPYDDEASYPVVGVKLVPGEAGDQKMVAHLLAKLSPDLAEKAVDDLGSDIKATFAGSISKLLQQCEPLAKYIAGLSGRLAKTQPICGIFFGLTGLSGLRASDERLVAFIAAEAKAAKAVPLKWGWRDYAWRLAVICCLVWAIYLPISYMITMSKMTSATFTARYLTELNDISAVWPELIKMQEELEIRENVMADGGQSWWPLSLSYDRALLDIRWQVYGGVCRHWLLTPFYAELGQNLTNLNTQFRQENKMPPDDVIQSGYSALKAYLMLDRTDRMEPDFLAIELASSWRKFDTYAQPEILKKVAKFYAENYQPKPAWQLPVEGLLVDLSRKTLIDLIGLKEADEYLYQDLLERGRSRYSDLTLTSVMGGHNYSAIWSCQQKIPGVFTRQAWEGYVELTIERLSNQPNRANDWVLNEHPEEKIAGNNFEKTRQKMTERYFRDYSQAWTKFLNSVKWKKRTDLGEITEQLKIYSDPQLSPLPVLIKAVAYQGQAGMLAPGVADALVEKTQGIFNLGNSVESAPPLPPSQGSQDSQKEKSTEQLNAVLTTTFAPFIKLANSSASSSGEVNISLDGYMERITRTRVKLEQVMNSSDPNTMARQITQVAFKGNSNDLTGTQQYGALVSASFGVKWSGICENIFVKPLDLTWEELVKSTVVNLNQLWSDSVVSPWNEEFAGLYPFNNTQNDASIPALARFLHPDRGMVLKFINNHLAGVLEWQGDKWIPNPLLSNALNFDPHFLATMNSVGIMSQHLFSQGDVGYYFELMPLPSLSLEETEINIDGQTLRYVNQRPGWKQMSWPGDPMIAGVRLTWRTTISGLKKEHDLPGRWSLLRLLEDAHIEQVDAARYQLRWTMPDNEDIYYMMKVDAGAGPLELLNLRNFRMPLKIFIRNSH